MKLRYLSMMVQREKYLSDIQSAIELIEDFVKNTDSFGDYNDDLKTQSAVERQLGIIGEAVNRYRKISGVIPLVNANKIVAFRNRLVHAYDSIDNAMVWAIIKKYLPGLKDEVEKK